MTPADDDKPVSSGDAIFYLGAAVAVLLLFLIPHFINQRSDCPIIPSEVCYRTTACPALPEAKTR
jgi:hypothetical protein